MPVNLNFSKLDLMDALDMAIMIEAEAYERYKMFADQLGHHSPGDAGSFFDSMAGYEAKHGQQLHERRKQMFGNKPLHVSRSNIFDVEAPDFGSVRWNMSTFKALQLALQSEEKAYSFFDEALKHILDPEVRSLFSDLRDEETDHIRMVKEAISALPPGSDVDLDDEDEW